MRADVLEWVSAARGAGERYDLVFCDPPTFSNSKRMRETWDVQRDHVALIRDIAGLLAEDGLLVFSCNRRKFVLDEATLTASRAGLPRTSPRARSRRTSSADPNVHACWTIRRRKG